MVMVIRILVGIACVLIKGFGNKRMVYNFKVALWANRLQYNEEKTLIVGYMVIHILVGIGLYDFEQEYGLEQEYGDKKYRKAIVYWNPWWYYSCVKSVGPL